jgi:hypothetical protein
MRPTGAAHLAPDHHDRGAHAPAGGADRGAGRFPGRAGDFHDDPFAPVHQFRVGGPQVHHQIAVGLAQANQGAGGEGVEHQLGRGARLHAGRAGHHFGTGQYRDGDVAGFPKQRGRLHTGEEYGAGAQRLGAAQCGADKGGGPAGGDADHGVKGADFAQIHFRDAGVGIVLGAFDRTHQRGQSPRDDSDHHLGRGAEGGRTLRGVEHAQPPAGAGSHVNEPAAGAEGGLDQLHGPGDRFPGLRDRRGDRGILRCDQIHDFQRGGDIDAGRPRIAALGKPERRGIAHAERDRLQMDAMFR